MGVARITKGGGGSQAPQDPPSYAFERITHSIRAYFELRRLHFIRHYTMLGRDLIDFPTTIPQILHNDPSSHGG